MRLATFNVENMFDRPAIMNLPKWSDGRKVLEDFADLTNLAEKDSYSAADKSRMLTIMDRNTGLLTAGKSKYIALNKIRGSFLKKPKGKPAEIVANGRSSWIGWFELRKEHVEETAIENTARVINEVNADVLCVVEADNRIVLTRFNEQVIPKVGGQQYDHAMLIDGNDERGIDVGIMTRRDYPIESIVSHVYDTDAGGTVFSRDCAEYRVATPSGRTLLVLVNHFKSKGYGPPSESNARRERQARQARKIYDERLQAGFEYIVVAGDLNDTPDGAPLAPLLADGALVDIMAHPSFAGDGRPGTHGNGNKSGKLDYILMSPKVAQAVQAGGIERRGVWGGTHGTLFPHFPEIEEEKDAASDHAALWVDLNL
ncbi:endonuclease/exonuclease/phosphatase family protein [Nitrososphaera sp.]|uniref:endonuclease/exonuclease/phosphatase family protein n=1 Tax=Nitrososphaera sp. TaxID=1971748 RepID=UPI0017BC23D5|nr:endonuclease/exonuclease/phosphatase family protein [Nitrososphaera sp.]NWG36570.1 endonuclease/exonuclease/phosphatase family protein [Nitrososphaera sp.]